MAVETAPARDAFALTEEERGVRDTVRDWAQKEVAPGAAARDDEERYDRRLFERAGDLGLTGIPYPEEYGGAGMGTFAWALAAEEIAAADMSMAVSLSVHILSQLCIFANGTDEQKARFLPGMTAGRELGAFALTEPGAGSDAASLSLAARRDGDAYLLSGTKIWITNAGEAARYVVFATVDRSKGKNGITAFVVEADTPGFRLGSKERKMGIRGTTGYEIVFEDARVPAENRLGEEGQGLTVALSALGAGRISIAAACTGLARNALELAARYALQRRQFGRAIADQEMIQAMLAEMAVGVDAARLLTWRAARMRDAGQPINSPSSMAKW
jgi:butyryl-CoA dehydrogenase